MKASQIFPRELQGVYIGKGQWRLTAAFEYRNPPVVVEVLSGFVTDGASIPKFAYSLIGSPWGGRYSRAAVVHDYLYSVQTYTRLQTDKIFKEGMKVLGVGWWRRGTMYNCVRLAGWIPWKKSRKKLKNTN